MDGQERPQTSKSTFSAAQLDSLSHIEPQDTLYWARQGGAAGKTQQMDWGQATVSNRKAYQAGRQEQIVRFPGPSDAARQTMALGRKTIQFEALPEPTESERKGAVMAASTIEFNQLAGEADFVMRQKIGQGAQGEVWQAWQSSLYREIAVKRMLTGDLMDFLQEAYVSAALDHPNIVPVHEIGQMGEGAHDLPLLAMKLVRGEPWHKIINADRQAPGFDYEAFLAKHIAILSDIANATAYAHSKNFIHRDLKPQQVMAGDFGEVYLMDWGLAICLDERVEIASREGIPRYRTLQTTVNRCGTPAYMAPEQTHESPESLGFHTDVYLLGAILYTLVAGRPPHYASSAVESFDRATINDFDPLPPECPSYLKNLVIRSLSTNPGERPASVKEFNDALRDYLGGANRQQESKAMAAEARRVYDRSGGEHGLTYEALALIQQKLGRSLQLWPENPEANALKQQTLRLYCRRAIEAHDLQLARSLALDLRDPREKDAILQEVEKSEAARDRLLKADKHRRLYLAGLMVAIGFGLAFFLARTAELQEASGDAAFASENVRQAQEELERQRQRGSLLAREMTFADALGAESLAPRSLDPAEPLPPGTPLDGGRSTEWRSELAGLASLRSSLAGTVKLPERSGSFLMAAGNLMIRSARNGDDFEAARGFYLEAAKAWPGRWAPLSGAAIASARAGKIAEASDLLDKAASLARGTGVPATSDDLPPLLLATAPAARRVLGEDEAPGEDERQNLGALEGFWGGLALEIAESADALGEHETAGRLALAGLPAAKRAGLGGTLPFATACLRAGESLAKSGRSPEAARFFLEAFDVRRQRLGEESGPAAEALGLLANAAAFQGWERQARSLQWKAFANSAKATGPGSDATFRAARELFRALAWPNGSKSVSDRYRQSVLLLGNAMRQNFESRQRVAVQDVNREQTGWVAVEIAMAHAAVAANAPDLARAHCARARILADLAGMSLSDPRRQLLITLLGQQLGVPAALANEFYKPLPGTLSPDGSTLETAGVLRLLEAEAPLPSNEAAWEKFSRDRDPLEISFAGDLEVIRQGLPRDLPIH